MENYEDIIKKIHSGEPEAIREAVQAVKENGDLVIAGKLLDGLEQVQDAAVTTVIANLLADIKDNRFKEILIQKLESSSQSHLKKELLRIVWESSLDYSSYLDHFLNILQNEEFEPAFEASTVIENMVPHLTAEQCSRLNDIITSFPEDKKFLVDNILEELKYSD